MTQSAKLLLPLILVVWATYSCDQGPSEIFSSEPLISDQSLDRIAEITVSTVDELTIALHNDQGRQVSILSEFSYKKATEENFQDILDFYSPLAPSYSRFTDSDFAILEALAEAYADPAKASNASLIDRWLTAVGRNITPHPIDISGTLRPRCSAGARAVELGNSVFRLGGALGTGALIGTAVCPVCGAVVFGSLYFANIAMTSYNLYNCPCP